MLVAEGSRDGPQLESLSAGQVWLFREERGGGGDCPGAAHLDVLQEEEEVGQVGRRRGEERGGERVQLGD